MRPKRGDVGIHQHDESFLMHVRNGHDANAVRTPEEAPPPAIAICPVFESDTSSRESYSARHITDHCGILRCLAAFALLRC
jgi:hypothetical protein